MPVSRLVHWLPKHALRKPVEAALTYIVILKCDRGLEKEEIKIAMQYRKYENMERHCDSRNSLDIKM